MANDSYPTGEQLRDRDRKHVAGRMEEEAQLREAYGTPEERAKERLRVGQEWDKIEHDKAQGMNDSELWGRHLRRMRRMAASLKDPKKAARRATHFDLAGLSTAAKYFRHRAESLTHEYKKPIDPQKDLLIDNLQQFNKSVALCVAKWGSRRPGEIWTRPGGQRVVKRPDGTIVPYFGPKKDGGKKKEEEKYSRRGAVPKTKKKIRGKGDASGRTLLDVLHIKTGANGSLISAHFAKSEEVLAKLVRAYLATQEEKSEYKERGELTKEQKQSGAYIKYNKGIRQAESMAKTYGEMGLAEHEKKKTNSAACRFLLASCLVFVDMAAALVRKRNSAE